MNEDYRVDLLNHPIVVLTKKQVQGDMRLNSYVYNQHFSPIEDMKVSKTSFPLSSLAVYRTTRDPNTSSNLVRGGSAKSTKLERRLFASLMKTIEETLRGEATASCLAYGVVLKGAWKLLDLTKTVKAKVPREEERASKYTTKIKAKFFHCDQLKLNEPILKPGILE